MIQLDFFFMHYNLQSWNGNKTVLEIPSCFNYK